jgi:hypothetical protein
MYVILLAVTSAKPKKQNVQWQPRLNPFMKIFMQSKIVAKNITVSVFVYEFSIFCVTRKPFISIRAWWPFKQASSVLASACFELASSTDAVAGGFKSIYYCVY